LILVWNINVGSLAYLSTTTKMTTTNTNFNTSFQTPGLILWISTTDSNLKFQTLAIAA